MKDQNIMRELVCALEVPMTSMRQRITGMAGRIALALGLVVWGLGVHLAHAQDSQAFSTTQMSAYPPNLKLIGGAPMMTLVSSRDHTLFAPIYTDFEDIDGDGVMDTSYKSSNRYYGYFDQDKCYRYNNAASRFEPVTVALENATTHVLSCAGVADANNVVKSAHWLGNFLNWATMTRVDVIRKMLYGGYRVVDTASDTTLQMAHMSQDAHSFVKYYGGADVGAFTPFSDTDLGSQGLTICNRGSVNSEGADRGEPRMRLAKGNYSLWATIPSRVVCRWASEGDYTFGQKTSQFYATYGSFANANQAHKTSLPADANKALAPVVGGSSSAELTIRVQACVKSGNLSPDKRCKAYLSDGGVVYKPTGILQDYGTASSADLASRVEFALLSGSYDWNLRGGALRKNMGSLNDEIDLKTGRFCDSFAAAETKPGNCKNNGGIIATFDSLRLYEIGNYNGKATDMGLLRTAPLPAIRFVLPDQLKNGAFPSWGNPMSEMLAQALYYLSNKDMGNSALFAGGASRDIDNRVGVPAVAAAIDPYADTHDSASGKSRKLMFGRGICRPSNILAISSGSTNFDADQGDSVAGVQSTSLYGGMRTISGSSIGTLTNLVGQYEGIDGTWRSVGANDGGFGIENGVLRAASCTLKEVKNGLAGVAGICPDSPGIKGTYLGAGAAFFANTHFIRDAQELLTAPTDLPPYAGRVKTYAASLAGGVARIEVPVGGRTVVITPESSWNHGELDQIMPGAMLTFKAIGAEVKVDGDRKPATFLRSGSYVVTWNDTQFGGDYDMDLVGFLRWEVHQLADGSYRLDVLTDVLGHDAGAKGSHGYSIVGVDAANDKRYLTHGSNDMKAAVDTACNLLDSDSADYVLHCRFANAGMANTADVANAARDAFNWPTTVTAKVNGVVQTRAVNFIEAVDADATNQVLTTTTRKSFAIAAQATADAASTLRDPLWYMAKYGSFDTGEKVFAASKVAPPENPRATTAGANRNWDKVKNNGAACTGDNCADGEPDGYFLARRPELLEDRLRNLFEGLNGASNSAVAVSSAQLIANSLLYVSSYEDAGNVRGGTIKAYKLQGSGNFDADPTWSASEKLNEVLPSNRVVITHGPAVELPHAQVGAALRYDSVDALFKPEGAEVSTYVQALGGGTNEAAISLSKDLIDYLRGEKDGLDGQQFINRGEGKSMGAVVSSTPWLQDPSSTARLSDADFPSGTPSYATFALSHMARNKVLWVGANDGLLHGFEALTGRPMLSFLPGPLVSSLSSALAFSRTEAMPLMDGSPFTGDVLVGSGTGAAWKTYLFASLGRGGKGVFALDVSDTGTTTSVTTSGTTTTTSTSGELSEGNARSIFKWVFTAADDQDLGHNLSDPVFHPSSGQASPIVRLNNGKFAVLVPNGFGSANGLGALYLLFVDGPTGGQWTRVSSTQPAGNYVKLTHTSTDSGNGYTGVTWADLNNDTTVDVIYVTDLHGKVWKYDVRDADPRNWGAAFKDSDQLPKPFFSATSPTGQALPITTSPVITFPPYGGVTVSFGTGKSIENGDFPNWSEVQRFYSVWDAGQYDGDQVFPPTARVGADGQPLPNRAMPDASNMLEILLARDANGGVYRYEMKGNTAVPVPSSRLAESFDPNGAKRDGWFFNFPSAGEQLIFPPTVRRSFISFSSVRPKNATENESSCTENPFGTFYGINPSTGQAIVGLLPTATPEDGVTGTAYGTQSVDQRVISTADLTGRNKATCVPGGETPCDPSPPCDCGVTKSGERLLGNKGSTGVCGCLPMNKYRLHWREISGMRTR